MQYTDPPGMLEEERMTDAEFKVVREYLGLSGDWLAGHLDVNPRTVRSWEQGRYPIPDSVRLALEDLERRTGEWINSIVDKLMDLPEPGALTYRNDAEFHAHHPGIEFPASWHRAATARIAERVPGLPIKYADPLE